MVAASIDPVGLPTDTCLQGKIMLSLISWCTHVAILAAFVSMSCPLSITLPPQRRKLVVRHVDVVRRKSANHLGEAARRHNEPEP